MNETDIKEASYHDAIILGMDVTTSLDAIRLAKEKTVVIKQYKIIYGILDDIKNLLEDNKNNGKSMKKVMG